MVEKADVSPLKQVLDTIELFPSEMLDDMIFDYFENPESSDIWFTEILEGVPISIAYCAQEKLTEGTWNLYALGVKSNIQSKGTGSRMMGFIETLLKERGERILIIDTSSSEDFASTRTFYEKLGYTKEAVIRDFWEDGDDKVIYWKKFN